MKPENWKWGGTLLATMLVAGTWAWSGQGGDAVKVDLALAPAAADFSDLDARDAQGRPVVGERADALRNLFVSSLFGLLTSPELPRVAQVLSVLRAMWNSFETVLRGGAAAVWDSFVQLWAPPFRKFNPRLPLIAAVALLILAACRVPPLDPAVRLQSHLAQLSSTLIRC